MIEFLSLFVGLVIGVHKVDVAVASPVARVEFRLDGEVVGEVVDAPWAVQVDFGRVLLPVEFEAVAFDSDGDEIGRDRQFLNLPGQRAEAEIVAIRDESGAVTAARLTWTSPEFNKPRKISMELDGRALKVRPQQRIDLTDIPEADVHVLTAEFEFSSDLVLRRELVFGPEFEGEHDSGLTAVAVVLDDLDDLPPIEAMDGWFVRAGTELRVAAVEKPGARVVLVRDPTVVHRLAAMDPELEQRRKKARRDASGGRMLDTFDDDVDLLTLSPEPMVSDEGSPATLLFPFSAKPNPGSEGVVAGTIGTSPASLLAGPLMMSDAVAVAGIRAAEGNGRRAVILLLGQEREDGSRFPVEAARGYLDALKVPLIVWDLSGPTKKVPPGWGDARPVDNVDDLVRAVRRVRYQLDEQRIIWINGRHLPQDIELGPKAKGISLAQ
jgi:hypothetical protein